MSQVSLELSSNPFEQFALWFKQAQAEEGTYFNAMSLSTIRADGSPTSRVVLLKEMLDNKFVFFTNYKSPKGEEINKDPRVCLNFFWQQSFRQVRIEGTIMKINRDRSVAYFHSRPRGSQISAMSSQQSFILDDRSALEQKVNMLEQRYENQEIPCPEHWGGYEVTPQLFEFWIGMPNRLHHRVRFELKNLAKEWTWSILQP